MTPTGCCRGISRALARPAEPRGVGRDQYGSADRDLAALVPRVVPELGSDRDTGDHRSEHGRQRSSQRRTWTWPGSLVGDGDEPAAPLIAPVFLTPERLIAGLQQMVTYLHQKGSPPSTSRASCGQVNPGCCTSRSWAARTPPSCLRSWWTPGLRRTAGWLPLRRSQMRRFRSPGHRGKVRLLPEQVKLFADGAIISQLMQMNDPYVDADGKPDPSHEGEWLMLPDTYAAFADAYWQAGWQLHTHVSGDRGLDMVLDTLEQAMIDHPRADHRAVIVHFANSTEEQVERIARLGAIVSANPYYVSGFADKFAQSGLGPDRSDAMVRSASVLKHHIPLSFHSDLPMGPADPLNMVWCAVNRITQSGRVAGGEQCISVHDALRAVTIEAAYSWRMENELGSIAPEKQRTSPCSPRIPTTWIRPRSTGFRFAEPSTKADGSRCLSSLRHDGPGFAGAALSTSTTDHQGSGCSCDAARMVSGPLHRFSRLPDSHAALCASAWAWIRADARRPRMSITTVQRATKPANTYMAAADPEV